MRKLYLDIETSPCEGVFWRPGYNLTLTMDNITREAEIIGICWKFSDEQKVHRLQWNYKDKKRDKGMLKKFSKVYEQADCIVTHNGINFDIPWIRTQILIHDLPPLPQVKLLDTYRLAKKYFRFASNKLDYITKALGGKGKIETRFQLWKDVLKNKPGSLKEMMDYCANDVLELEHVEQRLSKHIPDKRKNMGMCRHCLGGIRPRGWYYTEVNRYRRYKCNDCGKWQTDTKADKK